MKKRLFLIALSLLLVLTMIPSRTTKAEGNESNWWEQDYWPVEVLLELGAVPPAYNADLNRYEISSPEQLLFLTGVWKTEDTNSDGIADAPSNGVYVLTEDLDMSPLNEAIGKVLTEKAGSEVTGYIPPISALADETQEEGVKCAFFGTFDGQYHAIRNLRVVRMGDKYCGLFGNIGHDFGEGYVKNLAILDAEIIGRASCGILAGSVYGDVDNIVCTGTIDCREKTAGGLAGKVKRNDNGYYGIARNCFVYADILVRGKGNENGAAGGITSSCSGGGQVVNCYAGGTIRVLDEDADCVAGLIGNLKGGVAVDNNVVLLTKVDGGEGSTNVGLLCGNYSGDSGSHIHNNYVWKGTNLFGGVSSDHPKIAAFTSVGASDLMTKAFYTDSLGWDFDSIWSWVGEEENGYPMIAGFENASDLTERISTDLLVSEPVLHLSEPMVNSGYEGDSAVISASVTLPEGSVLTEGSISYGTDKNPLKFTASVPMTISGNELVGAVPCNTVGKIYYRVSVLVDDEKIVFPSEGSIQLNVISAASRYAPEQLTLTPGKDFSQVLFNWITDAEGLTSELRVRKVGASAWEQTIPVTEQYRAEVRGDRGSFTSYSVDLDGLEPDTAYEYMAVTNDGARDYFSKVYSFTTLPDSKSFSFIVISDMQSTNEEGYKTYLYTSDTFLKDTIQPDFVANVGDLTEDDTMSEWAFMYDTLSDVYASTLTAFAPGNHESKGDVVYTHFKGRTNLPDGIDDEMLAEATSAFIVGDVCFVTLNTEPYTGIDGTNAQADKMNYYQMQKEWAKEVFESSGCSWRIILAHAGLIQKDPEATAFLEQMCDELDVDLFFNGHIHDYYRATVDGEGHARELGEATTFMTVSPMGPKFDDYGGEIDDILQFQTGGISDPRQYFAHVEAAEGSLTVTVYQRASAAAANKTNCSVYNAIDSFTLTKEVAIPQTDPAPAEPAAQTEQTTPVQPEPEKEPTDPAPAPAKTQSNRTGLWICLGILAVAVIVLAVAVVRYKKKKA